MVTFFTVVNSEAQMGRPSNISISIFFFIFTH
jgi:hypothetical protein